MWDNRQVPERLKLGRKLSNKFQTFYNSFTKERCADQWGIPMGCEADAGVASSLCMPTKTTAPKMQVTRESSEESLCD